MKPYSTQQLDFHDTLLRSCIFMTAYQAAIFFWNITKQHYFHDTLFKSVLDQPTEQLHFYDTLLKSFIFMKAYWAARIS